MSDRREAALTGVWREKEFAPDMDMDSVKQNLVFPSMYQRRREIRVESLVFIFIGCNSVGGCSWAALAAPFE